MQQREQGPGNATAHSQPEDPMDNLLMKLFHRFRREEDIRDPLEAPIQREDRDRFRDWLRRWSETPVGEVEAAHINQLRGAWHDALWEQTPLPSPNISLMALEAAFHLGRLEDAAPGQPQHAVYADDKIEIRVDLAWRNVSINLPLGYRPVEVFADRFDGMTIRRHRPGEWVKHLIDLAEAAREAEKAKRQREEGGLEEALEHRFGPIDDHSLFETPNQASGTE